MTIEETKAAIKVMQAYVDGKEIQSYYADAWHDVTPAWSWDNNLGLYRIKPEPYICPYKNKEEFLKVMKEHGGWLLHKEKGYATMPVYFDNSGVDIMDKVGSYAELLELYTWLDGAPCGVVEE